MVAANVVDTSIEVHVDLSRVTHEAFRERTGTVWLPLLVLPPVTDPGSGAVRPVAPSPRVTDAAGATLPPLPQSEARQWTAAALTEIMLNLASLVAPPGEALTVVRREHRLLLSAAVHRVLRDGTDGSGSGPGLRAVVRARTAPGSGASRTPAASCTRCSTASAARPPPPATSRGRRRCSSAGRRRSCTRSATRRRSWSSASPRT